MGWPVGCPVGGIGGAWPTPGGATWISSCSKTTSQRTLLKRLCLQLMKRLFSSCCWKLGWSGALWPAFHVHVVFAFPQRPVNNAYWVFLCSVILVKGSSPLQLAWTCTTEYRIQNEIKVKILSAVKSFKSALVKLLLRWQAITVPFFSI